MTQYYFLDESGDPGRQSTSYFALALVQLATHEPITEIARARQELHLAPGFEFKYHKATTHQKETLFRCLQPLPFRIRATVIEKKRLPALASSGQDFIVEWTTRLILRANELDLANDVLVMDDAVPSLRRALRLKISEECRKSNRQRPFAKIVSADSKRDDGLQLADMVVGAIRQFIVDQDDRYYRGFAHKVIDLWRAP